MQAENQTTPETCYTPTYEMLTPTEAAAAWACGERIESRETRPLAYQPLRGWERIDRDCGLFIWNRDYRRQIDPPVIEVNGQEILVPIRSVTDMQPGQSYWYVELSHIALSEWDNTEEHHQRLMRGQCYRDEMAARQARRALIRALGGNTKPVSQSAQPASESDS